MGVKKYRTKKKETFWEVDEWLTLPDGSRKRFRVRKVPTKEQAVALQAKARAETFEGKFFEKRKQFKLTVKQLWEEYKPVSKQHKRSHRNDCNRSVHLVRHLGSKQVTRLSVADVEYYRSLRLNEKAGKGKRKKPKPATLDREVALLKRMCSYAVEAKLISENPIAGASMLNQPNTREAVVSEEQFTQLYAVAEPSLKPILLTAYETGMRKSEILNLKWEQVDLSAATIRLQAQDTKTDKPRLIIMTKRLVEELRGVPHHIRSLYVFVNPTTGKPWNTIRKAYLRACKEAKLNGVWFHDLRRSFVTNARRRGVPESVVMRMSGHKTRSVFDRYNIVEEEDLREAVRKIEAAREHELSQDKISEEGDLQENSCS